jgi:hypothetical protein
MLFGLCYKYLEHTFIESLKHPRIKYPDANSSNVVKLSEFNFYNYLKKNIANY